MDLKLINVAREGLSTIFLLGALGWLLSLIGFNILSTLVLFLTLFTIFFFRNPDRNVVEDEKAVISPADGKVIDISNQIEEDHLDKECKRISIFLSILDCHINRFPVSGKVLGTKYKSGKFVMAFNKHSSKLNERLSTFIETKSGVRLVIVQVAGFLARRIVSEAKLDSEFSQGSKFGMIKFGSRVDVYVPLESKVEVSLGQKVSAGETVLAWLN